MTAPCSALSLLLQGQPVNRASKTHNSLKGNHTYDIGCPLVIIFTEETFAVTPASHRWSVSAAVSQDCLPLIRVHVPDL